MKKSNKKRISKKNPLNKTTHKKRSAEFPDDHIFIEDEIKTLSASFFDDEDDFSISDEYNELNERLVNITIQSAQKDHFCFGNI